MERELSAEEIRQLKRLRLLMFLMVAVYVGLRWLRIEQPMNITAVACLTGAAAADFLKRIRNRVRGSTLLIPASAFGMTTLSGWVTMQDFRPSIGWQLPLLIVGLQVAVFFLLIAISVDPQSKNGVGSLSAFLAMLGYEISTWRHFTADIGAGIPFDLYRITLYFSAVAALIVLTSVSERDEAFEPMPRFPVAWAIVSSAAFAAWYFLKAKP